MATNGVGGTPPTTNNTPPTNPTSKDKTANPLASLSENYETFLTMLTTQLKNQDPLQPQDTTEFTNQLVNFSQVEQQIAANKKLDALVAAFGAGQPSQALGYMGKVVEADSDQLQLMNNYSEFTYELDRDATSATLEIYDSLDRKVATKEIPKKAGEHNVTWDGKDASGNQLPDGTYKIKLNLPGADGKQVGHEVRTAGLVTGVDYTGTEPMLMLGTLPLKMSEVLRVRT
ncbi:MAG TPA: flagellar hook assembly protein FlgD [Azospirillaceae bacterium]|nr:flagellar hook assembly protein FlgD [Azospirillaceae bacterium]